MLDIIAMILIVVEENLPFGMLWTPMSDLFYALMFWFIFLLVAYCLVFCFMWVTWERVLRSQWRKVYLMFDLCCRSL